MEKTYPRKFYRLNASGKKELKYDKDRIGLCIWCGRYFLAITTRKYCCKWCMEQWTWWYE